MGTEFELYNCCFKKLRSQFLFLNCLDNCQTCNSVTTVLFYSVFRKNISALNYTNDGIKAMVFITLIIEVPLEKCHWKILLACFKTSHPVGLYLVLRKQL